MFTHKISFPISPHSLVPTHVHPHPHVYMHMCVCMRVCVCVCVCMCVCVCECVRVCVYFNASNKVHMLVLAHTSPPTNMCTKINTPACLCTPSTYAVYPYIPTQFLTHAHTHTHIHIHTHTHTHTHMCVCMHKNHSGLGQKIMDIQIGEQEDENTQIILICHTYMISLKSSPLQNQT